MGIGPAIGGALREGVERAVGYSTAQSGEAALQRIPELFGKFFGRSMDVAAKWGESSAALMKGMRDTHLDASHDAGQAWGRIEPFVSKFNRDEQAHLVDVIEAKAQPRDERFVKAAQAWRQEAEKVSEWALRINLPMINGASYLNHYDQMMSGAVTKLDGTRYTHPEAVRAASTKASMSFQPVPNYWPRYYSESAINKFLNSKEGTDGVRSMITNGFASDTRSARAVLERSLRMPGEFRGGSMQHARLLVDPDGYSKSVAPTLSRYLFSSYKRLHAAERFGLNDERAVAMMARARQENPKASEAFLANVYAGYMDQTDPRYRDLARLASGIHSITLLSTAGIIQPAQLTNPIATYGWVNTIKAMADFLGDPKQRAWARATGATMENLSSELLGGGVSDLSRTWMRIIGLEHLDRSNRVISAIAAGLRADELAKKLRTNPLASGAKQWTRDLEDLGVNTAQLIQRGGVLTKEELSRAGLQGALKTQFGSQAYELPEMRNSPAGNFIYMFKTFALQQAYFINDLRKEAQRGNVAPLLRYASAVAPAGLYFGPLMRGIKGRDTPDSYPAEVLEDLGWVGGGGAFFDSFRALESGPQAIYNYMLGPTASEAVQFLGSDVPPAVGGDFGPMVKHLVRRTPLLGNYIYNTWFQ